MTGSRPFVFPTSRRRSLLFPTHPEGSTGHFHLALFLDCPDQTSATPPSVRTPAGSRTIQRRLHRESPPPNCHRLPCFDRSGSRRMSAPHGGGSARLQFPGLPSLCTRHRAGAERTNPACSCLPPERLNGGPTRCDPLGSLGSVRPDMAGKFRPSLGGARGPSRGRSRPTVAKPTN